MKTIEQIKDEVAIEKGWDNWKSLEGNFDVPKWTVNEVAERYAEQAIDEAAERAKAKIEVYSMIDGIKNKTMAYVDKQSILTLKKELK